MDKVFIAVLSMGKVHIELVNRLIVWSKNGAFPSATVGVKPVDHARNEAVRAFLKTGREYLFFVDEDTIPPVDAIEKLLAVNKDIVSGMTPILRQHEGKLVSCFNVFTHEEIVGDEKRLHSLDENSGIHKIERCGTSCLLIHRSVFEKMPAPWFITKFNEDYTTYTSEDLNFCDMARAKGIEIYTDTSVVARHAKEVML